MLWEPLFSSMKLIFACTGSGMNQEEKISYGRKQTKTRSNQQIALYHRTIPFRRKAEKVKYIKQNKYYFT